jgi:hypothetical protein
MFSKVSKKIVAGALVAALAVTCVNCTTTEAKAAKLNKKSLSLTVGGADGKLTASANAKWSTSKKSVANVSKKKGKSINVIATGKGSCTITAKIGKKKVNCKVKVGEAKSGTLIYDLKKETGSNAETKESFAPPVKCPYSTFKYSSFAIWLCRATLYDPANGGKDYRGKKLSIMVKFKNSGKNDLAELGFCFNYTKPVSYPFAYHVINEKLRAQIAKKAGKKWSLASVKKDKAHKNCKVVSGSIKKGKTYTYNFTYTIPKDAMNGDKDPDTNLNYPIMFYIPNLKDNCPYQTGDEVTVLDCKIKVA